jgi:hypothetical protein
MACPLGKLADSASVIVENSGRGLSKNVFSRFERIDPPITETATSRAACACRVMSRKMTTHETTSVSIETLPSAVMSRTASRNQNEPIIWLGSPAERNISRMAMSSSCVSPSVTSSAT